MSLSAAVIDALVAAGATVEQLAAAVKADMAEAEQRLIEKRAKDRDRQRRHRMSRDVTVTPCDTPPYEDTSTPLSSEPEGSSEIGDKRANPFPKPDWADPQVWKDFLANRKRRRLQNTVTAYRGFLADIEKFSTAEWPPGRLLEHATRKGWGGIYDPTESQAQNGRRERKPEHPFGRTIDAAEELIAELARPEDGHAGTDHSRVN